MPQTAVAATTRPKPHRANEASTDPDSYGSDSQSILC